MSIGVKVFSATSARDRELLGGLVTEWVRQNPQYAIYNEIVTQSSDAEFHCLTITLFYRTVELPVRDTGETATREEITMIPCGVDMGDHHRCARTTGHDGAHECMTPTGLRVRPVTTQVARIKR